MDKVLSKLIILCSSIFLIHGLIVTTEADDYKNFYSIDTLRTTEDHPVFDLVKTSESSKFRNRIPEEAQDYNAFLSKAYVENFNKYVIVKAKKKSLEVEPYLNHNLELIKTKRNYMMMWLHMYCDLHPDCNKKILNQEMKKVYPYLEKE